MAEQENVKAIEEAYSAFTRGDIQGVLSMFADDAEWFAPGPTDVIPHAGKRQGREEIAQYFAKLDETEEVQEFVPKFFVAQDNRVVALGRSKARVKSTARTYESEWTHVFTFHDGKIVNFREFYDTAAAVEAFIAAPAQAAQAT